MRSSFFIASYAPICKRRYLFLLSRYNSKNNIYFTFSSAAATNNNDDGDGRETGGRHGNNATVGETKSNLQQTRFSANAIPRANIPTDGDRSLSSRYRKTNLAPSSFEYDDKLCELQSFIAGDHLIDKKSSSISSSSPSPPPKRSNNIRLSSTPPLHWSWPKPYINFNRFPSRANKNVTENNGVVSPRGNRIIKDRMNACRSIAKLIDIVYLENSRRGDDDSDNHYNRDNYKFSNVGRDDAVVLYPHLLVTFWEKLASLVKENSQKSGRSLFPSTTISAVNQQPQEAELNHRLATIINHTITALPQYHPGQLRNIAFAKATIVKDIGSEQGIGLQRNGNKQNMNQNIILYNQLATSNDAAQFWDMMQQQVLLVSMDNFRPKQLVSIAWSLATTSEIMRKPHQHRYHRNIRSDGSGNNNHTENVVPFFHALQKTFNKRRTEFSLKHLGNLAWSTMTSRSVDTTSVLQDFANEFVLRRKESTLDEEGMEEGNGGGLCDDEDGIDQMTLCQWASSYAKAGHKNEELFRTIAFTAIPMLREKEFDVRYLANLAYSFALAELPSSISSSSSSSLKVINTDGDFESSASSPSYLISLFDSIADASMEKLPSFTTQNFANIVWAYAKVGHPSPTLFDGVAREAMPRLADFSSQELANLAWAFSKFHHEQYPETSSSSPPPPPPSSSLILGRIAEEVSTRGLQSFTLQGVAMLAHSFATVGHTTNTEVWDAIDDAILTRRRELGCLECSHIARSYAMIGRRSDDVFRSIESVVFSNIQSFQPPGLSSLAWAYATFGYDVPDLYLAIAEQSLECLDEFNRVDEVMLVLALSRIDLPLQDLRDEMFARSTSHLSEYTGLDLFNMLIFYVRAGYKSKHWMEAMANEIISRAPSTFTPKMIAGIAHSFASVGCRNPALFNYLLEICVGKMEELEPKEAASIGWSFASMEFFDRKFFLELADYCDGRWQEFEAASLATLAWAYATAREDRPELFQSIISASLDRVSDFSPQGVSMLLWACSTAGYTDQNLFHSFEETAEMLLHECDSQSLVNIAWAYTVADTDPGTLFGPTSKFIDTVTEKFDTFNHQGLCQLHQWNIWRKSLGKDTVLPPQIEKRCYDEFRSQQTQTRRSKMQGGVMSELVSMGIHLEEEACTQSGISLDALIHFNGNKIAVEVDGPHHFVGRKLTGNSILKHRQVETIDGIPVVSLPYWELATLETSYDKQQYLRTKFGLAN